MEKIEFGFDWVIEDTKNRKTDLVNFHSEGRWEIAFVKARISLGVWNGEEEWMTRYEVGNPLLGGIKNFKRYDTAEKYFYEMVGRVHRDALARSKKGE